MKAVVVGATGAIGQHVVGHLLQSDAFSSVVTVGRRECTVPPEYPPASHKASLQQVCVGDLGTMQQDPSCQAALQGAHTLFCCLGTTRKDAGSAEAFKKVDLEYVQAAAQAAKAAGVKHFSLVTAQGANPHAWASDWAPFHGLLYMRTKGQAEDAAKAQDFAALSIWRPGLLERGSKARPLEARFARLLRGLPVQDLARLMVQDAAAAPTGLAVYENGEIHAALKEGRAARRSNKA